MRRILLATATGLLAMGLLELLTAVTYATALPHFEQQRQILMADRQAAPMYQNAVGQSYLNYVPAPGFSDRNGVQHNAHGYRGQAVPLARSPGVLRILCMGGSTTYGWGVDHPDQAYPAQLESLLDGDLPTGYRGVEVINAGLPFGTTAEMVTHYHFKFHFYEPDLVIINTGGNDVLPMTNSFYQPDYGHWRRQMPERPELSRAGKLLLRSRLASLLLIPLVSGVEPHKVRFVISEARPAPVTWYPWPARDDMGVANVPEKHVAFSHNLNVLLDMVANDGHRSLLVPFRRAPGERVYTPTMRRLMEENETRLSRIAEERELPVAPFPASVVSSGNWRDACHVNAAGAREKARHILEHARPLLAGS